MAEIVEHIFGAVKKHYVQVANYQKKIHLKDKHKGRVYQKDAEKDAPVEESEFNLNFFIIFLIFNLVKWPFLDSKLFFHETP